MQYKKSKTARGKKAHKQARVPLMAKVAAGFCFAILFVSGSIGVFIMAESARSETIAMFLSETRTAVETIASNIDTIYSEYESGTIDYNSARATAIRMVQNSTWDKSKRGFWALDYDGTLLAKVENGDLSAKPGDNILDFQDSNGRYIEQEIIETAKAGGCYIDFRIENESVNESYVGYALPTRFNFAVDATFEISAFDRYWQSFMEKNLTKSMSVIFVSGAVILLIVGSCIIVAKRR